MKIDTSTAFHIRGFFCARVCGTLNDFVIEIFFHPFSSFVPLLVEELRFFADFEKMHQICIIFCAILVYGE